MFLKDDIIAQKIVESLGQWANKKLERNHKVLKLLKTLGIGELKGDFASLYAYALVEFAVEAEPTELVLLFAAKKVKAAFRQTQVQQAGKGAPPPTDAFAAALENELLSNKKLALLTHIYRGHRDLEKEIKRFRVAFDYLALQTSKPDFLKKYNEDKKFQAEILAEKERKSFPYQVDLYLQKVIDDFQRDFLAKNYYIDLNGEVRKEQRAGAGIRGRAPDEGDPAGEPAEPGPGKPDTGAPYESVLYKPLDNYINEWLADDGANLLVLLGEYGTGKTTFLRHLAHRLAADRQEPGRATTARDSRLRIPLFFSLRDFEKNIESFVVTCCNREGITDIDYAAFKRRSDAGELVLMLDGFDEMTRKIDAEDKVKNFDKIRMLLEGSRQSKIILTARLEYFKSAADFREVFKHEGKSNYRFVYLLPFDDEQIEQYLQGHTGDPGYYWQQIKTIFDLHDLAKRPVLLQLIVDYLPGLIAAKGEKEGINASDLYRQCIADELRRKSNLDFMIPGKYRLEILQKLAMRMFLREELSFDTGQLEGELNLKQYFKTERAWEFEKSLNEFLTFTFLLREGDNRYRISHHSFRDYLAAVAFVKEIESGKIENFGRKRLTKEINHFIREQGPRPGTLLELVMTSRDLPGERQWQGTNAANILLKITPTILRSQDISRCRLQYADLSNCDLTGTNLRMANLSYARVDENIFNADFTDADFHGTVFSFSEEWIIESKKNGKTAIKRIPLDIQFIDKIIKGDYIYVDKTGLIADLINSGWTYFFLSRPRRFGKSLIVSTMKEIFSGNKELFKNLKVYDQIDWQSYPIIHFDFSIVSTSKDIPVGKALAAEVDKIARLYNLPITEGNHKGKFRSLIENLSIKEKKPVVILIDEYDKFIVDHINDDRQREINRSELKDFFSILKGMGESLRFLFITGVSRFTRVSIFSDLNNLIDLTFLPEYASIAGYTEAELLKYFYFFIQKFAVKEGYSFAEILHHIREWYNGYSWDGQTRVYNPYSILKLFAESSFSSHWYNNSTPTFLIQAIRERKVKIQELDSIQISKSKLENVEVIRLELIPLLFQTGYLTITGKITKSLGIEEFVLDYPNKDVRFSFLNHLLEYFSDGNLRLIDNITEAVLENRLDEALEKVKSIFAAVPYNNFDPDKEASYHALIHVIFTLILDNIGSEIQTNRGRIDSVIETNKYVYIFEFKMEDAQKALDQIHEKKYYEKYLGKRKEIVLVGVSFSKAERNIKEWKKEKYTL